MARNGTSTVAAKEPNDLYDSLSPESQQTWDEIGALGYTPEKGAQGLWFARKAGQEPKDAIGPCEHISVLLTMAKDQVAKKRLDKMLRKFGKYLTDKTDDSGRVIEKFYAVVKARGFIKIEEKEVVGSDHNVPENDA